VYHYFLKRCFLKNYRNRRLCRVPETLGKALKTLGKGFAECRTRQRGLGTQCMGKAFFAEYFFSGTRQRKAAVTALVTEAVLSVPGDTRQRSYLCRVSVRQHSAKNPPERVPMSGSLSSAWYDTRQSVLLCRVPETLHSAKNLYRCPDLGSLPSAMALTIGKAPLCRVLHSAK
jgi:hypothetical protein